MHVEQQETLKRAFAADAAVSPGYVWLRSSSPLEARTQLEIWRRAFRGWNRLARLRRRHARAEPAAADRPSDVEILNSSSDALPRPGRRAALHKRTQLSVTPDAQVAETSRPPLLGRAATRVVSLPRNGSYPSTPMHERGSRLSASTMHCCRGT